MPISPDPPTGFPSEADVRDAHDALASRPFFGDQGSGARSGGEQITFPMDHIAREGVSVVARLIESIVENRAGEGHVVDDVPIFTADHESKLLTETYEYPLPNGKTAKMLPCANGSRCAGMHPGLEGHDASGGVVLRGILTPEELSRFEQTGENPDERRLCVMCARLYISEAYFWCQENQDERVLHDVVLNWYVNPRDCAGGYKKEHMIPLSAYKEWNGMCGPIVCNSFHKMRLTRRGHVWTVDQSELIWKNNDRQRADPAADAARVFR